jgi:hypothetical protein
MSEDPRAAVLKALVSASTMDLPRLKVRENSGLAEPELDQAITDLEATGLIQCDEGWVRLSRSAVLAALRSELGLLV